MMLAQRSLPFLVRHLALAASLVVLLVPMLACGFGDDDQTTYPVAACGMQIELGSHFSQTASGPDHFAFTTNDASLTVEIDRAPAGDAATAREPATFLPLADTYDYDRESTIAGFTTREARTQMQAGAQIRARWGAAIETSQGLCYLRVTSLWDEGPDEMGEQFWNALHDRWLSPL